MVYWFLFLLCQVFSEAALRVERIGFGSKRRISCRNNHNNTVDWWMIYKPPSGQSPSEKGLNFSFITSDIAGKWVPSERTINKNSMLKYTLAPLYSEFRYSDEDHRAIASYGPRPTTSEGFGSVARGLLVSDEFAGLWFMHTMTELPNFATQKDPRAQEDDLYFPEEELNKGHLFVCLSGAAISLNKLARKLRELEPTVTTLQMPDIVKDIFPDFLPMGDPIKVVLSTKFVPKVLEYVTEQETLRTKLLIRRPGEKRCLYQTFAKMHDIVLDVYGHHQIAPTVCRKRYSVRKIDSISLNYPNDVNDDKKRPQVVYVDNQTDRLEFAVSTAAHWQRRGGSKNPEYWTCIGATASDDLVQEGGLILCMENYLIWRSFDIFKIKEPTC